VRSAPDELWPQLPWTRWVPNLAMLLAIALAVCGLPARMVTLGGPRVSKLDPERPGFAAITPCGIDGVEMTSVAREGQTADMDAVTDVVLAAFAARFGYESLTALVEDKRRDEACA